MKASEMRDLSPEEREALLRELRTSLMVQRTPIPASRNPGGARKIRREIARLLTVMHEERDR